MLAQKSEVECLWGPEGEECACEVAEMGDEGKHDARKEGGGRGVSRMADADGGHGGE
jgi:hypothetical protein